MLGRASSPDRIAAARRRIEDELAGRPDEWAVWSMLPEATKDAWARWLASRPRDAAALPTLVQRAGGPGGLALSDAPSKWGILGELFGGVLG